MVTSSIICTILISQIHHRGEVPIPYPLRRFTFDFLASVVFLKELKQMHGTRVHNPEHQNKNANVWSSRLCPSSSVARLKLLNGGTAACHAVLHKENEHCECKSFCECEVDEITNRGERRFSESRSSSRMEEPLNGKVLSSINVHLEQIIEALSEYENRRIETTTSEFRIAEWKAVGKVYDRFFFCVFVITMLTITVIFLMPPPRGSGDILVDQVKVATGRPTPTIT